MSKKIAVDRGGTFIDYIASIDGKFTIHKTLSHSTRAVQIIADTASQVINGNPDFISHGTTIATNAILQRKGARTALITTQGFRDMLFIGRQHRPDLYALQPSIPAPIIPREWCFEVPERILHDGSVHLELDAKVLFSIVDKLHEAQIESVAVTLLFAYVNPTHERLIKQFLLEQGGFAEWQIALSSDVLPEFREFERTSTVALEAYVRPLISQYVAELQQAIPASISIMKSDGGIISADRVRQQAVQTVLSGPAAGVVGALYLARLSEYENIITMDIGGTSTDVALCPGKLSFHPHAEIDGLPLRVRMLDIETIGAGGGSIAWVDEGGALRVGPHSAEANPGPIIYGRGGTDVTVSDANAVLNRIVRLLDGSMELHLPPALEAVKMLRNRISLSTEDTARGIIRVANSNIIRALRRVSIERGYDPRNFTLVAFGGAGPLHACEVAEQLSISRVLVPRFPGVMCAYGALVADVVLEYSQSLVQILDSSTPQRIQTWLDTASTLAHDEMQDQQVQHVNLKPSVDMRYLGQAYELNVPLNNDLAAEFHRAHQTNYGYHMPDKPIEIVNLRLQAVGQVDKPPLTPHELVPNDGANALIAPGHYHRQHLQPGAVIRGEALLLQFDCTTYVPYGWMAAVDAYFNLIIERTANG
ncbi:MAG: hydantoinase/oxoprolinase family protein [Chloroflexi bacterium]|nr:hydantoinase/oxoprolinase family protein [Chloroflexota bacterium]